MDANKVAQELVRALRGRVTQRNLARLLGYTANPVGDWEAGRRFPKASEVWRAHVILGGSADRIFVRFRAGAMRKAPRGDGLASSERKPLAHLHPLDPGPEVWALTLAPWLDALRGRQPIQEIARHSQASRYAVGRWLQGRTEPRLHQFLLLFEAITQRLTDFVALLVDIRRVPSLDALQQRLASARAVAWDEPWSEAIMQILQTQTYQAMPHHIEGSIARVLGIPRDEEARLLRVMTAAGLIRHHGGRYLPGDAMTVDTGTQREGVVSRLHWSRVAHSRLHRLGSDEIASYNVFSCSRRDLDEVRERLRACFREIRAIIAASEPAEVAGLVQIQLFPWLVGDDAQT